MSVISKIGRTIWRSTYSTKLMRLIRDRLRPTMEVMCISLMVRSISLLLAALISSPRSTTWSRISTNVDTLGKIVV